MKIEVLTIERPIDTDPDLSHLEDPTVQGQEYFADNQKRLSKFGDSWWMLGLYARAQVSYPTSQGGKRLEYLKSGGLWGIESDSNEDYFIEVSGEEFSDLRDHLGKFGISVSDTDWENLCQKALDQL